MADGDYERGRSREIGAIAAELKRLAAAREGRNLLRPKGEVRAAARAPVFVLNGWAASPHAWDLCGFMRPRGSAALPTGTTGVSPVAQTLQFGGNGADLARPPALVVAVSHLCAAPSPRAPRRVPRPRPSGCS